MQSVNGDVCAFFTGTDQRNRRTDNYRVIAFLSIMPCINILFLFVIFLSYIKRYIVYIFLSNVLPFFVSFRDHENLRNHRRSAQITEHKLAERRSRVSAF